MLMLVGLDILFKKKKASIGVQLVIFISGDETFLSRSCV